MKLGLSNEQFREVQCHLVEPFQRHGARVWCFGSRARGDYQPFSDLDIMIEADKDLSALVGSIQEYFQNSSFPYKVDLVEERNFAKSYRDSFDRDKILL